MRTVNHCPHVKNGNVLRKNVADVAHDFSGDVDAVLCEFEFAARGFVLFAVRLQTKHTLCVLTCLLGLVDVNVFTEFGDFGKDGDFVGKDFSKSPRTGEVLRLAIREFIGDLTDSEFGDQRRVSGKDADVSVAARDGDLRSIFADEAVLRGDDFEFESFSH